MNETQNPDGSFTLLGWRNLYLNVASVYGLESLFLIGIVTEGCLGREEGNKLIMEVHRLVQSEIDEGNCEQYQDQRIAMKIMEN